MAKFLVKLPDLDREGIKIDVRDIFGVLVGGSSLSVDPKSVEVFKVNSPQTRQKLAGPKGPRKQS